MNKDKLGVNLDNYIAAAKINELPITTKIATALRAVLELHKPEMRYDSKPFCSVCYTPGQPYEIADDVYYPCPTIQAIEKVFE